MLLDRLILRRVGWSDQTRWRVWTAVNVADLLLMAKRFTPV
jgi:hypothetical protein